MGTMVWHFAARKAVVDFLLESLSHHKNLDSVEGLLQELGVKERKP